MDGVVITNYQKICNATEYVIKTISLYVDLNYLHWLAWVFYPLLVTFLLPFLIFIFLYASAIFLHVYRLRHHLKDALSRGDMWDRARQFLSVLWVAQGIIWHGHEVVGMEKIPSSGPALLIYYHGALPVDLYYLVSKTLLVKNRQIRAVGDRFLFQIPGMKLMLNVFNVTPGTVSACSQLMSEGHLLAIAPGGVREAFFSDSYQLVWGNRVGFAKIAVQSKVPVIPVFTKNNREAFRSVSYGRGIFRKIYEKTRLPLVPIYGMFPVKLKTFIGDPIPFDPDVSPEDLAEKVKQSLEHLIHTHQKIPGSIIRALFERFPFLERPKQS